jgi:uncharacterized membrane protein YgcG
VPTQTIIQHSFAAGILSRRMRGRIDLQQYAAGAEDITNGLVQTQGGIAKRPGSYHVAPPATNARVRLVPFVVSSAVAYVLEFGNLSLRILRNRALLTDGAAPLAIATPWTLAQLRALKFAASADVLTIFHPDHQPRQLRRTAAETFALAPLVFVNGPYDIENTGDVGAGPPSAAETDPEGGSTGGSAGGGGTGDGPDPRGGGGGTPGGGGEGGDSEAEGAGGESGNTDTGGGGGPDPEAQ